MYLFVYFGSLFLLCRAAERPVRRFGSSVFDEFSQILRGGGEQDFISGTAQSAQPEPVEFEDPLHMGEGLCLLKTIVPIWF